MNNVNQYQSILDRAIIFATNAHSDAKRKGTELPYILHPLEAAAIVATMTEDINIIVAAVLHDVLEDTPVTVEQLECEFGTVVTRLVSGETENKRIGHYAQDTWKIRKQETIEHLKYKASMAEKMIALGDKLSNIRAICRDYGTIGDKLWNRFNQKEKTLHAWYYINIAETLSDLKEYTAWQEYDKLVSQIFR